MARTTTKKLAAPAATKTSRMNGADPALGRVGERKTIQLENVGAANWGALHVTIESTAPLLVHQFSEKARRQMEEKQQGMAKTARKKAPKVPEEEFLGSLYFIGARATSVADLEGGDVAYGFPAAAFKQAIVRVASLNKLLPMTEARQALHVQGDPRDRGLVEILTDSPPRMQTDVVRLQGTTTDIRYRGAFDNWSVALHIDYHARIITAEQILSLLVEAGIGVGVGEWRPCGKMSSGTYGTWSVKNATAEVPNLD